MCYPGPALLVHFSSFSWSIIHPHLPGLIFAHQSHQTPSFNSFAFPLETKATDVDLWRVWYPWSTEPQKLKIEPENIFILSPEHFCKAGMMTQPHWLAINCPISSRLLADAKLSPGSGLDLSSLALRFFKLQPGSLRALSWLTWDLEFLSLILPIQEVM